MIIKIFMLVALIKLLMVMDKPMVCAGIYTGVRLLFALLFGNPFLPVLIGSVIVFGLSLLYFWLLSRFQDSGVFWIVLILGLAIVFV